MREIRRKLVSICGILIIILIAFTGLGIFDVSVKAIDAVRTRRSAWIDRPQIIIENIEGVSYPDREHLVLPDGRRFRMAHVIALPVGTSEFDQALQAQWLPLGIGYNQMRGLRVVGKNAEGEALVEMWDFQHEMGRCGSNTWAEDREMMIPHWLNLTWQLVASGNYRLAPGETDSELITWQDIAEREHAGAWKLARTMRTVFNADEQLAFLRSTRSSDNLPEHTSRLTAADRLLRMDRDKYKSVLLAIVREPRENDLFRIHAAQLLEKNAIPDGTAFLMHAIESDPRQKTSGLSNAAVVDAYETFWEASLLPMGDVPAMLTYYRTRTLIWAGARVAPEFRI